MGGWIGGHDEGIGVESSWLRAMRYECLTPPFMVVPTTGTGTRTIRRIGEALSCVCATSLSIMCRDLGIEAGAARERQAGRERQGPEL